MSLSNLLNLNCTVVRRSTSENDPGVSGASVDTYGNPVSPDATDSLTDDTEDIFTVCWVQQDRRTEPGDEGEMSDSFWTIFLPWGTDLDTGDAVEVDGYGVFELVGDPWPAQQGSQRMWHVEATGRRTGPLVGS